MININKAACQCCGNKNSEKYTFTFGEDKIDVYVCKNCLRILRDKINEELQEENNEN